MNPNHSSHFEHTVCVDHTALLNSAPLLNSIDHEYLHPAAGPHRTPRLNRRTSPYGSPVYSPPSSPSEHLSPSARTQESDSDGSCLASSARYTVRAGRVLAYDSDDDLPVHAPGHRSVHANASVQHQTKYTTGKPPTLPSHARHATTRTTRINSASASSTRTRRVYAYDSDDSERQVKQPVPSAPSAPANGPGKAVSFGKAVSLGGGSSSTQATTSHTTSTANTSLEPKKNSNIPLFLDSDSDSDDDDKIAKPLGEAGRPGRGGYNLRAALNWPEERYGRVKRYINSIVQDKMECTVPYTEQPLLVLKQVRDLATAKYPFLTQYRDNWPIDDFIRSQLKYRKAALQKEAIETELTDIRNRATKSGKRSGRKGQA
ncbi:hypothetical protein FB446DRAFT_708916 [Lentinula raphanica]|nr:hypothetical protein FB446DRAFT_708916 [Lentinula raphanica]